MSIDRIWEALEQVKDPEIPSVSIVELGMVRSVGVEGGKVTVGLAPTFLGCPALGVIRETIVTTLQEAGAESIEVKLIRRPPWTSDWINPAGRQKLKAFGLAPPPPAAGRIEAALDSPAACPYCGSLDTRRTNDFGPTLCRSIHVCDACRQPFEAFKPV
jgi:ring-1,2-phenylacetyl-CoA epoxidase subunit PaaD